MGSGSCCASGDIISCNLSTISITVLNCIFINRLWGWAFNGNGANSIFRNNIVSEGYCQGNNLNYNMHSASSSAGLFNGGTGNSDNFTGINMSTVFVDFTNRDLHLSQTSVASKKGINNEDLGAYGGLTPFVDKGIPDLPSIYYLNVPSSGSQQEGLNITIKAKTNK
jgi:hypothetical protein